MQNNYINLKSYGKIIGPKNDVIASYAFHNSNASLSKNIRCVSKYKVFSFFTQDSFHIHIIFRMANTNSPYKVPESSCDLPAFWKRKTSKKIMRKSFILKTLRAGNLSLKEIVRSYGDFNHF